MARRLRGLKSFVLLNERKLKKLLRRLRRCCRRGCRRRRRKNDSGLRLCATRTEAVTITPPELG